MTPRGERVRGWLTEQRPAMEQSLRALVTVESPSREPSAQDAAFDLLARELEQSGMKSRRRPGRSSGGQLLAQPVDRRKGASIQLLLGHIDTVWPLDTIQQMPLVEHQGQLAGPGVYDMKAGLIQICFALRCLRAVSIPWSVDPVVLVNSDEEIGSVESRGLIERLSRIADRALVMEPSLGRDGRLKTARKGVGRFHVTVHGKAAHAGLDPESGVSAILELSHVIQQLFALNDPSRGITVNVGNIDGGLRPNVIAPQSRAVVDARVPDAATADELAAAIKALQPRTPGARIEVEGGFGRPPMEPTPGNRALWGLAKSLGAELGLVLAEGTAGGGSDGNFTSLTTPTLDGLGAVGDGAHAAHEFVFLDAMVDRTALLALLVAAPEVGGAP